MKVYRAIIGAAGIVALAVLGAFAIGNPNVEHPLGMLVLVGVLALNVIANYGALLKGWPL